MASALSLCPICLQRTQPADEAFLDRCFHCFCFQCILQWTEAQQAHPPAASGWRAAPAFSCPLCKAPYSSIVHNCHDGTYRRHYVESGQQGRTTVPDAAPALALTPAQRRRRSVYFTPEAAEAVARQPEALWAPLAAGAEAWVRRELAALTLDEDAGSLVAQLVTACLRKLRAPAGSAGADRSASGGSAQRLRRAGSAPNARLRMPQQPARPAAAGAPPDAPAAAELPARREAWLQAVAAAVAPYVFEHARRFACELATMLTSGLSPDAYDRGVWAAQDEAAAAAAAARAAAVGTGTNGRGEGSDVEPDAGERSTPPPAAGSPSTAHPSAAGTTGAGKSSAAYCTGRSPPSSPVSRLSSHLASSDSEAYMPLVRGARAGGQAAAASTARRAAGQGQHEDPAARDGSAEQPLPGAAEGGGAAAACSSSPTCAAGLTKEEEGRGARRSGRRGSSGSPSSLPLASSSRSSGDGARALSRSGASEKKRKHRKEHKHRRRRKRNGAGQLLPRDNCRRVGDAVSDPTSQEMSTAGVELERGVHEDLGALQLDLLRAKALASVQQHTLTQGAAEQLSQVSLLS